MMLKPRLPGLRLATPWLWNIFHACSYITYNFIKVGTRFSYCAPVFGQFRGILDTFINTELIFLRIPRELVIIYLCKRTPYGITALVFISICSSRPFPFTARKCFQKARLDPEGVLFLGVGGHWKPNAWTERWKPRAGEGRVWEGIEPPDFSKINLCLWECISSPFFPYSITSTLSKVRHPSY